MRYEDWLATQEGEPTSLMKRHAVRIMNSDLNEAAWTEIMESVSEKLVRWAFRTCIKTGRKMDPETIKTWAKEFDFGQMLGIAMGMDFVKVPQDEKQKLQGYVVFLLDMIDGLERDNERLQKNLDRAHAEGDFSRRLEGALRSVGEALFQKTEVDFSE